MQLLSDLSLLRKNIHFMLSFGEIYKFYSDQYAIENYKMGSEKYKLLNRVTLAGYSIPVFMSEFLVPFSYWNILIFNSYESSLKSRSTFLSFYLLSVVTSVVEMTLDVLFHLFYLFQ